MKNIFSVILLLWVVLFVVVSCGPTSVGGDQTNVTATTQETATNTSGATVQSQQSANVTEDKEKIDTVISADEKAEVSVKGSDGISLKDVLSHKGTKYTADYDLTVDGNVSSYTLAFDLPKFAMHMKLENMEIKTIMDGEFIHSCNNAQGSWMCVKIDTPTPLAHEELAKEVNSGASVELVGSCSVVGETGSKYKVKNKEKYEATVCYTNDGILLEMEALTPKVVSMKATRVVRSVDSEMFVVPAQSQDLQSMLPPGVQIPTQ